MFRHYVHAQVVHVPVNCRFVNPTVHNYSKRDSNVIHRKVAWQTLPQSAINDDSRHECVFCFSPIQAILEMRCRVQCTFYADTPSIILYVYFCTSLCVFFFLFSTFKKNTPDVNSVISCVLFGNVKVPELMMLMVAIQTTMRRNNGWAVGGRDNWIDGKWKQYDSSLVCSEVCGNIRTH